MEKVERISDNQSLVSKESKFFVEEWSENQKKSYLKKEVKKVFANPHDNEDEEVLKMINLTNYFFQF